MNFIGVLSAKNLTSQILILKMFVRPIQYRDPKYFCVCVLCLCPNVHVHAHVARHCSGTGGDVSWFDALSTAHIYQGTIGDQHLILEQEKGWATEQPLNLPYHLMFTQFLPPQPHVTTQPMSALGNPRPGSSHMVLKSGWRVSDGFFILKPFQAVSAGWWQMLAHIPHFTWAFMFAEGIAPMGKKAIFHWKTGQGASSESKHLE